MERTAQQLIFPHRQRTPGANKLGAVKPAFNVALVAKARGSLNKLLVRYDIYFFIALGWTKEVRVTASGLMPLTPGCGLPRHALAALASVVANTRSWPPCVWRPS